MILEIDNVLSKEELQQVRDLFEQAPKQDGKLSAGPIAVNVKNNDELASLSQQHIDICTIVQNAILRNEHIEYGIYPVNSSLPLFSRYTKGMSYGEHLDIAITTCGTNLMSGYLPGRLRADVSATLFLSAPDEYEGGELVIQTGVGVRHIKGNAGSMVLYPSGYIHQVNEVTSGQRDVGIFWFQSYIADKEKRHLLNTMTRALGGLIQKLPNDADVQQINYVYNNLLRSWANNG